MNIAFAIVTLSPSGGLQRECTDVARTLQRLGHTVTIFTSRINGDFSSEYDIRLLPAPSRTNHGRSLAFSNALIQATENRFDKVVGFDFLRGLDVLYCANPCMRYRVKRRYLLLPRYRTYVGLEGASFRRGSHTRIILLSENQKREFQAAWQTEAERITVLPPTVSPERLKPEKRTDGTRARLREKLGLGENQICWLSVCAHPRTKGLDRTIKSLSEFPDVILVVCGLFVEDRKSLRYAKLARELGVDKRIVWLGPREDIPDLLAMADVLVHPSRYDTTGTIILEAIINGLPVVTTDACGYSDLVLAAKAGLVLRGEFLTSTFKDYLLSMKSPARRQAFSDAGVEYGKQSWLYQSRGRAADAIINSHSKYSRYVR